MHLYHRPTQTCQCVKSVVCNTHPWTFVSMHLYHQPTQSCQRGLSFPLPVWPEWQCGYFSTSQCGCSYCNHRFATHSIRQWVSFSFLLLGGFSNSGNQPWTMIKVLLGRHARVISNFVFLWISGFQENQFSSCLHRTRHHHLFTYTN